MLECAVHLQVLEPTAKSACCSMHCIHFSDRVSEILTINNCVGIISDVLLT